MTDATHALPQHRLDHAAEVLHALTHQLRLQIVDHMATAREATVLDLQRALGHEAGVLSNHLRVLRQSGVVTTSRTGKYINYHIVEERLGVICEAVSDFGAAVEAVTA